MKSQFNQIQYKSNRNRRKSKPKAKKIFKNKRKESANRGHIKNNQKTKTDTGQNETKKLKKTNLNVCTGVTFEKFPAKPLIVGAVNPHKCLLKPVLSVGL